jgi:hypothetical protein
MPSLPDHASKGFHLVPDTAQTDKNFYGFSVLADTALSAIVAPTTNVAGGPEKYTGNYSDLVGPTFVPGYYPIRGSSITSATADAIILWLE